MNPRSSECLVWSSSSPKWWSPNRALGRRWEIPTDFYQLIPSCAHTHTLTHSHTVHKYAHTLRKPIRVVCSSGSGGFLSILVLILMNARVDPQLPFLISDQPSLPWNMPWQWGAPNWLEVWIVVPPFNHWIQYVRFLEEQPEETWNLSNILHQ